MNSKDAGGIHWSFWVIGAVALIWHVLGCMNFISQMNPDTLASMPEAYRPIIEARPGWATAAFGVAVFGGALGSLLLLVKKSAGYYLFVASLIGVIVTFLPLVGMANVPVGVWAGSLMSFVVAAFLIWYSKKAETKGWIS